MHACIPGNLKIVTATTGCGTSHKDSKHTDKSSNNKTKQHKNNTTKPQTNTFSKYCKDNTQKSLT